MEDTEDDRLERGVQMLRPFVDIDVDEVAARWQSAGLDTLQPGLLAGIGDCVRTTSNGLSSLCDGGSIV